MSCSVPSRAAWNAEPGSAKACEAIAADKGDEIEHEEIPGPPEKKVSAEPNAVPVIIEKDMAGKRLRARGVWNGLPGYETIAMTLHGKVIWSHFGRSRYTDEMREEGQAWACPD